MKLITYVLLSIFCTQLFAAVKNENISYTQGTTKLEGYLAAQQSEMKRPAILIVHDWMGISEFTKAKTDQLAKEGYVAMAADIYGSGVRPKNSEEASKQATLYKSDRNLLRARVRAAYDLLAQRPDVDPTKIVVMGYCFGGTTALELARSGAALAGTVSFHGGLSTPTPDDARNIKGRVLVLHGADDPYVPAKEVDAFKDEMKKAKVKMDFRAYPGAVHSFAVPTAGNDPSKGAAYNAKADKESWKEFEKFLKSVVK